MKVGFLITARMKSTRLPKKLTLKIDNREIIALMIDRLKLAKTLDEIIIATSTNPQDDILCEIAERENIKYFRGSEEDVLERLYYAAKKYNLDYLINLTADCPLVAYDFIEKAVKKYKKTSADLITCYGLPHGFYFWGIKISALKKILEIKDDIHTEVWSKYFNDTGLFNVLDMKIPSKFYRKNFRLTLDYPEDYKFFKELFNKMGKNTHKKPTQEIINFLDKHPEIVKINEQCEKEYKKRWDSQNKLILK